jgi:hypothetical protein
MYVRGWSELMITLMDSLINSDTPPQPSTIPTTKLNDTMMMIKLMMQLMNIMHINWHTLIHTTTRSRMHVRMKSRAHHTWNQLNQPVCRRTLFTAIDCYRCRHDIMNMSPHSIHGGQWCYRCRHDTTTDNNSQFLSPHSLHGLIDCYRCRHDITILCRRTLFTVANDSTAAATKER